MKCVCRVSISIIKEQICHRRHDAEPAGEQDELSCAFCKQKNLARWQLLYSHESR
jgi:hypothetical protein